MRWSTGELPTDYGFTGQQDVPSIGLVFMRARFYHAYLNRWIQPDTIIPNLANPQSLNRYSYVYNRPLAYVDRDGHFPWPVVVGIAGIVVGGALGIAVVPHILPSDPPMMVTQRVADPITSSDMTGWLRNQMVTNARSGVVLAIRENWTSGNPMRQDAALQAWTALVGTGATWDFKVDILVEADTRGIFIGSDQDIILGMHQLNYDAVANTHFGFVGRAAGLSNGWLTKGAGAAQFMRYLETGDVNDFGACNTTCWCDHPYATYFIEFGIYLYDEYGETLDDAAFAAALAQYINDNGAPPAPPPGAVTP